MFTTDTVSINLKTVVKLTPEVKQFLKMFNFIQIDEEAEALAIADNGRMYFIKDLEDLNSFVPLIYKLQLMSVYTMNDLTVEFPV